MIQIIAGLQGAGKTKNLIDKANAEVKTTSGHIVYVDTELHTTLQLSHKVRLVNTIDYPLQSSDEFFGFVCGILSQDYDICTIYIDGLLKNAKTDIASVADLVHKFELVSEKNNVDFQISMSCNPADLPESVQKLLVE